MEFLLLYEFCMKFCYFSFFSIFFVLKLVIFGGPLATENRDFIFGILNFWRLTVWPPKIICYFRRPGSQPPKIAYFRRQLAYFRRLLAAENDCICCSARHPQFYQSQVTVRYICWMKPRAAQRLMTNGHSLPFVLKSSIIDM
jgi:hypothetical protein